MDTVTKVFFSVLAVLVCLLFYCFGLLVHERDRCVDLGGAYLRGYCVERSVMIQLE